MSLEIYIHPMCPYSQRVLYLISYKRLPCTIHEVDQNNPPAFLSSIDPDERLPALKITTETKTHLLFHSLIISEYLDSLPGPTLYPRLSSGSLNTIEKTLIDLHIATSIDGLAVQISQLYSSHKPSPRDLQRFKRIVGNVEKMIENAEVFTWAVLGRNELTFIDVMALPLIERLIAVKDLAKEYFEGLSIENLVRWYSRVSEYDWVQRFKMPMSRYQNQYKDKGRLGLRLPLSLYDSQPAL